MPLEPLPLTLKPGKIPDKIAALLAEAERRSDEFFESGLDRRYPRYLPSDPALVHSALVALKDSGHLRGNVFCEWGCGLGIATCMASLLGFEASGIEIEEGLADLAAQLAEDLNIPVEILCLSYLPEGFEECEGIGGKDLLTPGSTNPRGGNIDTTPTYDGLDPGEVDLFFAYPWPGQEELMMDLFNAIATEDAILLIYHADGETTAHRQNFDDRED